MHTTHQHEGSDIRSVRHSICIRTLATISEEPDDQAQALWGAFMLLDCVLENMAACGFLDYADADKNEPGESNHPSAPDAWRLLPKKSLVDESSLAPKRILAKVDTIAERELALRTKEGNEEKVTVRLGHPFMYKSSWHAPYEIIGPHDEVMRYDAIGEDSIQALILALYLIPTLLENIAQGGELRMSKDAPGHWFPRILLEELMGEAPTPKDSP